MAALRALVALAGTAVSCVAWSAGGHHAVDDASLMEPGRCEVESWLTAPAGGGPLLHAGAGCRVGAVELAASAEHQRQDGASADGRALQVKWAHELAPGFAAGISVTGGWQAHERPRHQGTTAALLLSWQVREAVALHANLGRDFVRGQSGLPRSGVAAEWSPPLHPGLSLTLERYLENTTHFARAGVRWLASEDLSVDFSRAQRLAGPGASNWTAGMTLAFGR